MEYKKKPVIIEAVEITKNTFDTNHPNPEHIKGLIYDPVKKQVEIPTLEGTMIGSMGDYIIKGVEGEYYPCKPDIFAKTYEKVSENDFKDRMKVEYYQLKTRAEGLANMLKKYRENKLNFTPKCSYEILCAQLVYMECYLNVLEERAKIEDVDLGKEI